MEDKLTTNLLKKRLFIVLFATVFFIFIFFISITIYVQYEHTEIQREKSHKLIHLSQTHVVQHYINTYKYLAKRLVSSNNVIKFIKTKDRKSLYNYLEKKWELLKKENPHFKKLHIHATDGTSLLRIHAPEKYNDKLDDIRPMIKEIHKTKKTIIGYESGTMSTLFRIIVPIFDKEKYIGAIEVGINPEFLVHEIEHITGNLGALFVKNDVNATTDNAEFSVDGFILKNDKNDYIFDLVKSLDKKQIFKDGYIFNYKDKVYSVHVENLKNFNGVLKIRLLFFSDITFSENIMWLWLYNFIFFALFVFFALLYLIGRQINIFENGLQFLHNKHAAKYKHLNRVLKTVLSVNKSIFKNNYNKKLLLENICINLKESEIFEYIWITLYDENHHIKKVITTNTKIEDKTYSSKSYDLESFNDKKILYISNIAKFCSNCILKKGFTNNSALVLKLQYKEKTYGVIELALSENYVYTKKDDKSLTGIADDIASALYNMQAQKKLYDSELKLKSIFRAAPIGIGVVLNRILKNVNDRFCKMIGYTKEELVEKNARMLYLSDEAFNYVGKEKYRQIKEYGTGTVETQFRCKDGSVIDVLLSSTPFDLSDFSLGVTFTAVDITVRKKMENQLLEHKENLEKTVEIRTKELEESLQKLTKTQKHLVQTEKMAALGGLVAGVAHEINTPVGLGITGITHFISETSKLKDLYDNNQMSQDEFENYINDASKLASIINENLVRAANLVKSFKQISIDQTHEEKREFRLKTYIEETLLSLHNKLKTTKIEVKLTSLDDNISINSYPGAFSQIVTNLIMNSLHHAYNKTDEGTIILDFKVNDSTLEFLYRDDGKGIEKEIIKKIFNPFFTTKREMGGSGLGLNIIYNIVTQKLNGTIECKSEVGKFTEFYIKIPILSS